MGRTEMTEKMTYNPETDVWENGAGRTYIKNEFLPESPYWIDISTESWNISTGGVYLIIDWWPLRNKPQFLTALQTVAKMKLRNQSPSYAGKIRQLVINIVPFLDKAWTDFGDISTDDFTYIWDELNNSNRITLREFYQQMVALEIGGARSDVAYELKHWKARNDTLVLRDVLQWHETKGALTSTEEKILREVLRTTGIGYETDKENATRIFGWLLLDTLKRASQVLGIRKDGLKEVVNNDGTSEWFVKIKPVKFQTGLPERWWRVSEELAQEIIEYSKREQIAVLQEKYDRLIVWDVPCLFEHGVIGPGDAKGTLTYYIYKRGAISHRTGKPLHVTPTRIRHTGATRLAFQGVSRDLISEILEHDNKYSAQAYIDAVGSEIVPAIEKADRLMGNLFFELNKGYFQGRVVKDLEDKPPVVVPEFNATPIIVGTCGRDTLKDGVCPKHPFLTCYDGCNCFFAWDNPDPHGKALKYFEKEIQRWEKSIEAAEQKSVSHLIADRTLQSYQRAAGAVKEILGQITKGE